MTNADRIRAMTDEKMARRFARLYCPPNDHCKPLQKITCYECWLNHLKQEVKDNA